MHVVSTTTSCPVRRRPPPRTSRRSFHRLVFVSRFVSSPLVSYAVYVEFHGFDGQHLSHFGCGLFVRLGRQSFRHLWIPGVHVHQRHPVVRSEHFRVHVSVAHLHLHPVRLVLPQRSRQPCCHPRRVSATSAPPRTTPPTSLSFSHKHTTRRQTHTQRGEAKRTLNPTKGVGEGGTDRGTDGMRRPQRTRRSGSDWNPGRTDGLCGLRNESLRSCFRPRGLIPWRIHFHHPIFPLRGGVQASFRWFRRIGYVRWTFERRAAASHPLFPRPRHHDVAGMPLESEQERVGNGARHRRSDGRRPRGRGKAADEGRWDRGRIRQGGDRQSTRSFRRRPITCAAANTRPYTVRKGDTLFSICSKRGASMAGERDESEDRRTVADP